MKKIILKAALLLHLLNTFTYSFGQYFRGWNNVFPIMQYGGLQKYNSIVDQTGNTYLASGTNCGNCAGSGAYLIKYNDQGTIQWQQLDTFAYFGAIKISTTGFLYSANSNNIGVSSLTLTKLNTDGNIIWKKGNAYSGLNFYNVLDFDSQGNIIVTGSAGSTAITEKYDTLGNLLWAKQLSIGNGSYGYNLLIDSFDNIYVGVKNGLVKYSSMGTELWNLPLDFWVTSAMSIDKQNNIYIVGMTNSSHLMGVNKIDKNGNILWSRSYGYGDSYANSIVIDKTENVYVGGSAGSSLNPTALSMGILLKYNTSGNLIWSKSFGGTATAGSNNTNQNITIKTYNHNSFLLYGTLLNNTTLADGFVAQVDTTGSVLWQDIFDSSDSVKKCQGWGALALDNDKNIYLSGSIGTSMGSNQNNVIIMKYNNGYGTSTPSIHGILYHDTNQDCAYNSLETKLEGKMIELKGSSTNFTNYAMTDTAGSFNFYAPIGNYQIIPVSPKYWVSTCNNGISVSLSNNSDTSYNNQLGLYMLPNIQDLRISVASGRIRAGQNINYFIHATNEGTKAMSGRIVINYDSLLKFVSAVPGPDTILYNKLVWNYSNLPCGQNTQIQFTLHGDTTLTFQDNIKTLYAAIEPVPTDYTPLDNVDSLPQSVFGPYDPNDKSINLNDTISVDDTLFTYTIQFQNLGNDTAFDVTLRDTLSDLFEIRTLKMGASSYPYSTSFIGNVMSIKFKSISLPPKTTDEINSQGFIKYSIKRKAFIAPGTHITNRAAIYFDYMPPVITNTTDNVYYNLAVSIPDFKKAESVTIFPNPAYTRINITGIKDKSTIRLYDSFGKLILEKDIENNATIDISNYNQGIYILVTDNNNERVFNKVVITQ